MKKLIEMVCTGNNGRSPLAEAIGRDYLISLGLTLEYDIISSGIIVDHIKSGAFTPLNAMQPIFDVAIERGDIYDPQELDELYNAINAGEPEAVQSLFRKATKRFSAEEKEHRDYAIEQLSIKSPLKQNRDQTIARNNTLAVIGMETKHVDSIRKIYIGQGPDFNPLLGILPEMAGNPTGTEVKNSFGLDRDQYMKSAEQLYHDVPLAIDFVLD